MINFIFLLLSFFLIFGNIFGNKVEKIFIEQTNITSTQAKNFDISNLSVNGQEAYQKLIKTEMFEEPYVGIAGTLSENVVSFGILLEEKNADAAFKSLLKNGTTAGQLYGLSGIYFNDYGFFQKAAAKFAKKDNIVTVLSGCIAMDKKVSEIVESNHKNVAIIEPGETIEDFWKSNQKSYFLDIVHGGYPATFKHAAEQAKK